MHTTKAARKKAAFVMKSNAILSGIANSGK